MFAGASGYYALRRNLLVMLWGHNRHSWLIGRNRPAAREAIVVLLAMILTGFLLWEVDILHHFSGGTITDAQVDLAEVIVFAILFTFALLLFGTRRLIEQQKLENRRRLAAEREARTLALHDPLTGLPNRRCLEEQLDKAMHSPPGTHASHALLLLDLNSFKQVNDIHGHPAGDDLLIQVGRRISDGVREGDLVARLGGDEFAVLAMHLAGPEAATSIASRIMANLEEPILVGTGQVTIGTAIGIALAPQDGRLGEELFRKADIALYRSKEEQSSAVRFFEPDMDACVRERASLEQDLRRAVACGELAVQYQPQVDLRSGAIVGFEALARWNHPTHGPIEPARFIPVAEALGLIGELTEQLLRRACRDAVQWPHETVLSFNISPIELKDGTLVGRVIEILQDTGFAPHRLELEITESAIVRDLDAAQAILGALREHGVRIALDDFGTGYSSLFHLRNFKLDKLKIDQSFIQSMDTDSESMAIVRALIGLGAGLNLAVTAEGIEDERQRAFLEAEGCGQGQGYIFSKAVSAAEAAAMFLSTRQSAAA